MQEILFKISQKQEIRSDDFKLAPPKKNLRILATQSAANKEKSVKKAVAESSKAKKSKETLKISALTNDEKAALDFYKAVRQEKKNTEENNSDTDHSQDHKGVIDGERGESTEEIGKRGINYQIAKNKGLTPHRSKEQRNPRVKHREKFRKAKIRRKGAVREVRKELSKYGGEISGIKASVVRSVKLK